jgi:hypothetical protein
VSELATDSDSFSQKKLRSGITYLSLQDLVILHMHQIGPHEPSVYDLPSFSAHWHLISVGLDFLAL